MTILIALSDTIHKHKHIVVKFKSELLLEVVDGNILPTEYSLFYTLMTQVECISYFPIPEDETLVINAKYSVNKI